MCKSQQISEKCIGSTTYILTDEKNLHSHCSYNTKHKMNADHLYQLDRTPKVK